MNICVSFYHVIHRQISGLKCISIWNGLFYLTNTKQDKGFNFNLFFKSIVKAFTRHLGSSVRHRLVYENSNTKTTPREGIICFLSQEKVEPPESMWTTFKHCSAGKHLAWTETEILDRSKPQLWTSSLKLINTIFFSYYLSNIPLR